MFISSEEFERLMHRSVLSDAHYVFTCLETLISFTACLGQSMDLAKRPQKHINHGKAYISHDLSTTH